MADYRKHYDEIRAARAAVAAISVDPPEKSAVVRRTLHLPFEILSDADRRVVQEWGIYNAREKGGIAKPSIFIVDRNGRVRFASVDGIASRTPAAEIVRILRTATVAGGTRRKLYFPRLVDFLRAICNSIRMGAVSRKA